MFDTVENEDRLLQFRAWGANFTALGMSRAQAYTIIARDGFGLHNMSAREIDAFDAGLRSPPEKSEIVRITLRAEPLAA